MFCEKQGHFLSKRNPTGRVVHFLTKALRAS